jgi:hypothetical protein
MLILVLVFSNSFLLSPFPAFGCIDVDFSEEGDLREPVHIIHCRKAWRMRRKDSLIGKKEKELTFKTRTMGSCPFWDIE